MIPYLKGDGRKRRVRKAVGRLWEELCTAHRLSWTQRRLLKHIAAEVGAPTAVLLFFKPSLFDLYLRGQIPRKRKEAAMCLRSQLFEDLYQADPLELQPVGEDGLPKRL